MQLGPKTASTLETFKAFDALEVVDVTLIVFDIDRANQCRVDYMLVVEVSFLPTAFFGSK